jgi:arylsulfatase A-like enzyme
MDQLVEPTTITKPSGGERLFNFVLIGFLAGLLLMLLESIDRLAVLWSVFSSFGQRFVFLSYFSANVLGMTALGLILGVAATALSWLLRWREQWLRQAEQGRWARAMRWALQSPLMLVIAAAALLAILFRPWAPLASVVVRRMPIESLRRVALPLLKTAGPAIKPYVLPVMVVAFVGLALLGYWLSRRPAVRQFCLSKGLAAVAAGGLLGLIVTAYALDSGFWFSLYDFTIHMPLFICQVGISLGLATIVFQFIRRRLTASQRRWWGISVVLLLGLSTASVLRLGQNDSLKSLFWSRSVMARRWVRLLQWSLDRDNDGYSTLLGGGDCDNTNPAIHPLARDIPNNGVDENCLGGDLKSQTSDLKPQTSDPATGNTPQAARNILVITIDALRADHLGCYGYHRNTSPHLDQLARRSRLFLRAHSQGTNTGHSFVSMLRSAYGAELFLEQRLTFVEHLVQHGYRAASFNAMGTQKWLEKERWASYKPTLLKAIQYDGHPGLDHWSAEETTDEVLRYLKQLQPTERHFVRVHYLEPHYPYNKHAEFDFGDSDIDRYDSEIAYTDQALAPLLQWVDQNQVWQTALVIITADHGEAFHEHGQQQHSSRPYQEQIHVPLITRHPRAEAGPESQPVGLIDLGPTILRYAGIPVPTEYQGWDLFSLPANANRVIFSETPRNVPEPNFFILAAIAGRWKLMFDVVSYSFELYDLEADPKEQRNLVDINREKATELKATLGYWIDQQLLQEKGSEAWSVRSLLGQ